MITLDDVLRDLTYGEFQQLNIGNFLPEEHENEPDPKSYAQLCSWLNLGLKAIYAEFWLASEDHTIQLYEAIDTYTMSYDFAATNVTGSEPIKYILDTADLPFTDNVLRIESVFDSDGDELPLNDPNWTDEEGEPYTFTTTTYRDLKVPSPTDDETIVVRYRATHPKIVYTAGMDPTAIEIEIPHALHEALLWYVASRAFSAFGSEGGREGNDYYRKYQARVETVKNQGHYIQPEPSNARFSRNGWC